MALLKNLLLLCLALFAPLAAASAEQILDVAERHVRIQTQGLPGKVDIRMGQVNTSRLPPCTALEAYTPQGARMSGKTTVGVRCLAPNSWNILVQVQITVTGNYVTARRPLMSGHTLTADDLQLLSGDLSTVPSSVVTDPANAVGKTLRAPLGAGQPLRGDLLVSPLVIRQGQSVRVISRGSGFSVSSEGKAINNASDGQVVQVRMSSGQTISGIARGDGSVEINF
jgi:flagellar basal body P-ring formation protein FlgA